MTKVAPRWPRTVEVIVLALLVAPAHAGPRFVPAALTTCCEPTIAVSPADPNTVVAGTGFGLDISHDGGVTFPIQAQPTFPANYAGMCGDGSWAFDSTGRLFYSYLACVSPRAPAGGTFWAVVMEELDPATGAVVGGPVAMPNPVDGNDDKPWIAADGFGTSPNKDNLYLVWMRWVGTVQETMFSRSTDHGTTWSAPKQLSANDGNTWPAHAAVGPGGDLYVAYDAIVSDASGTPTSGTVYVMRSTTGGLDWANGTVPVKRTALTGAVMVPNPAPPNNVIPNVFLQSWPVAWIVPDPSRDGVVYAVSHGSPSFTSPGDQGDVLIARSHDHGATWSPLHAVDDTTGAYQAFPSLAVDAEGTVFVTWYDTRLATLGASGQLIFDRRGAVSHDRGLTFAASFSLGPTSDEGNATRIAEYFGTAASEGRGFATWSPSGANSNIAWFPIRRATVTDVAPPLVASAGGTHVIVTGTNFGDTAHAQVAFGATPAASFTVTSDTTIDVSAPPGVSGQSAAVTVATVAGTSVPSLGRNVSWFDPFRPILAVSGGGCDPATIEARVYDSSVAPVPAQILSFSALRGHFGTATTVTLPTDSNGYASAVLTGPVLSSPPTRVTVTNTSQAASSSSLAFVTFVPPSECILTSAIVRATLELLSHLVLEPILGPPRPWADGGPWVVWHAEDPAVDVSARFASMAMADWILRSRVAIETLSAEEVQKLAPEGTRLSMRVARGARLTEARLLGPVLSMRKLEKILAVQKTPAVRLLRLRFSARNKLAAGERVVLARLEGERGRAWTTAGITALVEREGSLDATVTAMGTYALLAIRTAATKEATDVRTEH